MFGVLRNRNIALLSLGQLLSQTGDWLLLVAVPFYVYRLTGSALSTGAVFAVELLPRLVFAPIAGVLADRWDRQKVMVVTDIARAVAVCGLFAVTVDRIWIVYVVTLAESTLSQLFIPARAAILPALVEREEELMPANGLASAIENLTRIAGPPLGGALFAVAGLRLAAGFDVATYLASAFCIAMIRVPVAPEEQVPQSPLAPSPRRGLAAGVWAELRAGLAAVRADSVVTGVFIVFAVASIGQGIVAPLMVPLADDLLNANATQLGLLMGAQGLGALAITPLSGALGRRLSPAALISIGFAGGGASFVGLVNSGSVLLGILFMLCVGGFIVLVMISGQTVLQTRLPGPMIGRAFGVLITAMTAASLMGTVLAGAMVTGAGLRVALNTGGAVFLVGALVGMRLSAIQADSKPGVLSSTQPGTAGSS